MTMSSPNEPLSPLPAADRDSSVFMTILRMLGPAGVVIEEKPHWKSVSEETEAHFHRFHQMLSSDERTPARLLALVAREASEKSLERIAEHPLTSSQTLRELAGHPSTEVKIAVAENRNCPEDVLAVLACDENPDVRYRLAESYHVPPVILLHLIDDSNPYVAFRAQKTLQRLNQTNCEVRTFNPAAASSRRLGSMG
jgi:hypothetical protein